jgi:YbbR domain-containing protein
MIRQNWVYKLIALVGAIALWFYVNSETYPRVTKNLDVPIRIQNLSSGYVAELGTRTARVTIQGLKGVVDSVRQEDALVWVNLSPLNPGDKPLDAQVGVRARIADLPDRDAQVSVLPSSVSVHLEPVSGKRLPVELKLLTAPPLGFKFGNPVINPASITVSGRTTTVSRVKRVVAAAGYQADHGSIAGEYEVIPMDMAGGQVFGVTLDPPKIRLKVDLIGVPASKLVVVSPNVIDAPRFPAKVVSVSVTPESITLQGRPQDLAPVSTVTTDAISVRESSSTVTRDVAIHIPRGLSANPEIRRARVTVVIHTGEATP